MIQSAAGVRFIMSKVGHRMTGVSAYHFPIFVKAWSEAKDLPNDRPGHGDTVVGNDVWSVTTASSCPA